MGFIAKVGQPGFISGNAFIKGALSGNPAFMAAGGMVEPGDPGLTSYELTVGNDGTYWGFQKAVFGSVTPNNFEAVEILILETSPATDDIAIEFNAYPGYDQIIVNETYSLPYIVGGIYNANHPALSDLIAAGGTVAITLRGIAPVSTNGASGSTHGASGDHKP